MAVLSTPTTYRLKSSKPLAIPLEQSRHHNPWRLGAVRLYFTYIGRVCPSRAAKYALKIFSTTHSRARVGHKAGDWLSKAEPFYVPFENEQLNAYAWGNSTHPTVLVVHGWESRGLKLYELIAPLLEKGFRVVTFDGPAHGESPTTQTNMFHFGAAIRAVVQHVGGVYGIIGHSFGGSSSALMLARYAADMSVKRLVVVASPVRVRYTIYTFARYVRLPRPVVRQLRLLIEKNAQMPVDYIDIALSYPKIRAEKTLFIYDKDDAVVSYHEGEYLHKYCADAVFLFTEKFGHHKVVRDPAITQFIADFVAKE